MNVEIFHNGRNITEKLKKITIQEGTQRSDVTILKLFYLDGSVDTKVMLPFPLKDNYVILRKRDVKADEWERLLEKSVRAWPRKE